MRNFGKYQIACASVLLVCGLAFLISQLTTDGSTAAGANNSSVSNSPVNRQVREIEGYKNWTKVNEIPQFMPGRIAQACAIWLSPKGIVIDGESNPHRDKYLTVYVNEVGREAMLSQKHPRFPMGTVIVKEKLTVKDSLEPELLTVMIKKNKGFNPANGDWEYMVVDGTGTKVQGRGNLENCQTCHQAYQKTDYVFRTYLPREVASGLK